MGNHRILWAILCLAALTSAPARAQDSDVAQIRALEIKVLDMYKNHDLEGFGAILDEDFVITFEDGSTYSKSGYLTFSSTYKAKIEVADIPEMKIRLHGDTAIVTGVFHEKGIDGKKPYEIRDRFTDIWMRQSGKWRLVAAHYAQPTK